MDEPKRDAFYLVYHEEYEDTELSGTLVVARLGADTIFRQRRADGDVIGITTGGTHYVCAANYWGGGYCHLPYYDDDPFTDMDASFFVFDTIVKEIAGGEEFIVVEIAGRTIAGFEGRCFQVTGDTGAIGEVCVAVGSGVLLSLSGVIEGDRGTRTLSSSRAPSPADFELPFPVGEPSSEDLAEWPRQASAPSIPSRRIAGDLFHWETELPLCPDLQLPARAYLLAMGEGRFLLAGEGIGPRLVGPDCSVELLNPDVAQYFGDGEGSLYYGEGSRFMDSIRSAHYVVRQSPDGTVTRLAGAECTPGVDCEFGLEGPSDKVVLEWIFWIGVGTDGATWFMEFIADAGRDEERYRLRHLSTEGHITTVPSQRSLHSVSPVPGPRGLLYMADQNAGGWLIDSTGAIVVDGLPGGIQAFAPGRDGDVWRYVQGANDLVVRHADGVEESFHFAPEAELWPDSIAVQPNGDLLVKSTAYTGRPGLWLVPNPLNRSR